MRITYDSEVDALYIRFIETTVTTNHVAEGIAVDYDSEGKIAGIEILDAVKRFGSKDVFKPETIFPQNGFGLLYDAECSAWAGGRDEEVWTGQAVWSIEKKELTRDTGMEGDIPFGLA